MQFRTILYPTDFSEPAQEALPYAVAMAQEWGARLIVLQAVETLGPENVTYGEAVSMLQPASYQQRLWEHLRQIQIPEPHPQIEYMLSEDDPVTAILRTADERDCDLIVIGSHGRQGLHRLFEGSVAEQVVRRASCPVLVVKQPKKPRQPSEQVAALESPHRSL
ncbi:MAG TPA: universal stress protein [Gemmataceae bacterium]|nr:universal stress protein [Gemmataceae bacterium]